MSLVELEWRQFTFFEKHIVYDPQNPEIKFDGLKDLRACCAVSGDGFTLFGESCGAIFKLARNLDEFYWIAHKRMLADIALAGTVLATVGEDEDGVDSLVKLWDLNRIEKDTPFCLRIIRVCPLLGLERSICACSVAFHSTLQHIAVGFADSSLIYFSGNVIKEKSGKWLTLVAGSKYAEACDKISGICLAWLPTHETCVLFLLTKGAVNSYVINSKLVVRKVLHDAKGCSRDCWVFIEARNQLIVGSDEMVHFYDAEQTLSADSDGCKGRCHALGRSNEKIQLIALDSYVILLTRQPTSLPSSSEVWRYVVSIYDVDSQCVAFSCALLAVTRIFLLDSILIILSSDGTLSAVTEKHISAKLDILFKKNLYDLAVGVAKRCSLSIDHLSQIYKRYGDYLCKSGDFENAIQQYNQTVGFLEPSYVIKKFLDGSRIKELCTYLEVLHSKGKASAHHTTILLNCLVRLSARNKINEFIERDIECNLETVIQVLRAANFTKEACRLCSKHHLHDALLSILIEDCGDHRSALKYISNLDESLIGVFLAKYGSSLLEKGDATLDLLAQKACFGQIDASRLTKLFVDKPTQCRRFIEAALKNNVDSVDLRQFLLELLLRQWAANEEDASDKVEDIIACIDDENLTEDLRLCQMFGFEPGIIVIYAKQQKYEELIEYYMRQNDLKAVIDLCEKRENCELWLNALVFVSREENIDSGAIKLLLERIEQLQCIHPLVVLEILSRGDRVVVAHVKDYIMRWLQRQNAQIDKDRETIAQNEAKMAEIEKRTENVNYNVQIFQMNKCSACDTSLQLPVVHFLCKHSYHAHCLESYSERADHCPACTTSIKERTTDESELDYNSRRAYKNFHLEVTNSSDCMVLLSSYIASGLFNVPRKNESINHKLSCSTWPDTKITNLNPFDEIGGSTSANDQSNNKTAFIYSSSKGGDEQSKSSLNPFDE